MVYFNLKEVFCHMDYAQQGYLTKPDFRKFLEQNGVFKPTELDIDGLFNKFDPLHTSKVTFSQFSEELTCKLPQE